MGERHLASVLAAPAERAFWWPRFQKLARWFIATETARRGAGTKLLASEIKGAITLGPLTIEARADRIDQIEPGGWEIIDYKTGRVPSPKEVEGLFAPQLLLEAAMAQHGQFETVDGPARAVHLSYWQANGLGDGGAVKPIEESDALVPAMIALLHKMIEHFGNPATPYTALPWPEFIPHFNDYAHLERVAEWSSAGGEE
jgi:ATP-dependent helicase/nuclease subunit B